ncbi:hypothetical protein K503DRAFT_48760 [Rhizopogon vinicolor AM-OR11-026]|uniref:Uncharacterized protein n=1 Tax=Rhizopogon vinicolor AM-OR11-026 TaxID=1314800 RepID=A0A1B7MGS5_9AGAM|nr:hypothetical protein K503DRAFT_48760 [Rhizopogon vinicolor AM-OR11-026]
MMEDAHSSSLAYAATMNHQDDFDSITSDTKSTAETGTDFYDRSLTSRGYALAGVTCSGIFSISCIIAGAVIIATRGTNGAISYSLNSNLQHEILALVLNLIVTLCTESTGLVHGISLRSTLASESRLRFNTNLRLLTAARGWRNPNGLLLNGIMAVLLILSYTSASLVVLSSVFPHMEVSITGLPLFLLGVTLLLQVVIALSGMRAVKILTWSSSSVDVTAALVHHMQLTPVPFRCMRGVSDVDAYGCPAKPLETQPSAWHAHSSIRKVILSLWGLVVACAVWATVGTLIWNITSGADPWVSSVPSGSWSFFPNEGSGDTSLLFTLYTGVTIQRWILSFVSVALIQGPLTLGLHCSELVANVIRDERQWRCASGRRGLRMTMNPLISFFTSQLGLVVFVAKSVLHWMFALAYSLSTGNDNSDNINVVMLSMYAKQIWNLSIALFVFACVFTFVALHRPRGPQPAAYGHLQTLANLIDEWSPGIMWWGHKEDGIPYCHAGTSDHMLPPVRMDCVYTGSGVLFHSSDPLSYNSEGYTQECSSKKRARNLTR